VPRRPVALVAALGLGLAALTGVGAGAASGAAPARSVPASRFVPPRERYPVGVRVLPLTDASRATPADAEGSVAPSSSRRLPTAVFYPAPGAVPATATTVNGVVDRTIAATIDAPLARGHFPVILFSGGAPGTALDYAPLLASWATLGYVVVAPQFPVSSISGPTPAAWSDQPEQVHDARFVLDRVLALDRRSVHAGGFGDRLDRRHIAAAGHSMGGLTTLALVSSCCRDPRISAAIVLAGVSQPVAGPALEHIRGPLLVAHSSADPAVPFAQGEAAYLAAGTPKYLLEIDYPLVGGASHLLTYFPGTPFADGVAAVFADFLAGYLRGDGRAVGRLAADAHSRTELRWRADR
jgi:dienelactone hydrolase